MTRLEEAKLIGKITTSRINRYRDRISNWLPPMLHFYEWPKNYKTLHNPKMFGNYERTQPLPRILDSDQKYDEWVAGAMKDIFKHTKLDSVRITGQVDDQKYVPYYGEQTVIFLQDVVEFRDYLNTLR